MAAGALQTDENFGVIKDAFASKPAPTFYLCRTQIRVYQQFNVGAGLLANEGRNDLPAISDQN
ncbi:hypothetical protein CES87_00880 [Pseudomonas sp. ERMR1:02]|nr:hypothetical protein CES87_00880 [Pseudomonas sp. ERMR1:02]